MGPKHLRRQQQANKRLGWAMGLALLFHIAGAPLLVPLLPKAPPATNKPRKLKIVTLASSNPKVKPPRLRKPAPKSEIEQKEKEEIEKQAEKLEGQVVDIPPSPNDTPPQEARYLSEYNTSTEREIRSRHADKVTQNSMSEQTTSRQAELADSRPAQDHTTALEIGPETDRKPTEKKQGSQATVFELPEINKRDRLALHLDPELGRLHNQKETEAIKGAGKRLKLSFGDDEDLVERGSAPERALQVADLVPSVGVLARLSGNPANDHLEDLEEGEGTFLNSREFKYASFFNRMKRGVSQHWDPIAEYRRRDPSGNIYGYRSRVTVLNVTLAPDGSLKTVEVQRSSGVDFLDHEAVAAFQRAQPFPNPPKGLISEDRIVFPFGFHVDFSNAGGLRLPF